jgi:hypothetical protein
MPINYRSFAKEIHNLVPHGRIKMLSFPGNSEKTIIDDHNNVFRVWFNRCDKKAVYIFSYKVLTEDKCQ